MPSIPDSEVVASLDGDLTEDQLAALCNASVGVLDLEGTELGELVSYSDDISPEQFTSLCAFHNTLRDHDVRVKRTRATAESIHLEYEIDGETPEERGKEIQRIAGCYVSMFTDTAIELWVGGPLPDLHARGNTSEETVSWHVQWAWAEQFVVDNLGDTELLDRITETVTIE